MPRAPSSSDRRSSPTPRRDGVGQWWVCLQPDSWRDATAPGLHQGSSSASPDVRFRYGHRKDGGQEVPGCLQQPPHAACTRCKAHQPLLRCVWANLSFFFHYAGMYCHLIFMYAVLPDKYDLLPGNSSDVHSAPCSNYGSHPWRDGDHGLVVHLSGRSWRCRMPFYASLMLANTKEGKKKGMNVFA